MKVVMGIPVGKNHLVDVRTAAYCAAEAARPGVQWGYVSSRDCGYGRNIMIQNILQDRDTTHFYTLDGDVVPPADTLSKLLAHDLPIVAGVYPHDKEAWSFKLGDACFCPRSMVLPDEPFEATCIAGSTILIKREVLEKLAHPCFKVSYGQGANYEHEDEYFSRCAREAGYKLMVDPTIICKHYNYVGL